MAGLLQFSASLLGGNSVSSVTSLLSKEMHSLGRCSGMEIPAEEPLKFQPLLPGRLLAPGAQGGGWEDRSSGRRQVRRLAAGKATSFPTRANFRTDSWRLGLKGTSGVSSLWNWSQKIHVQF